MGVSHDLGMYLKSHSFTALTHSLSDRKPTSAKIPYKVLSML